jgi:hypothetical protein
MLKDPVDLSNIKYIHPDELSGNIILTFTPDEGQCAFHTTMYR